MSLVEFAYPIRPSRLHRTPSPADKPWSGSNWIHEIKYDGYRFMARRDPVGIRLLTRRGNDWSDRFPLVVEAVNHLRVRSASSMARSRAARKARHGLRLNGHLEHPDGLTVFQHACRMGVKGIV